MSSSEGETSNKQVIQVDVDQSLVKNVKVVPEPQERLAASPKIDHMPAILGGV